MAQIEVHNRTPFAFEPLVVPGADTRPMLVPLVKATFRLDEPLSGGAPPPADTQVPVIAAGEPWGEPGVSSDKYEPECAWIKPATDVVLIAEGHARRPGDREVLVRFQVGPLAKEVLVTGDRIWVRSLGRTTATRPEPFERIPLVWERAFGGWDRSGEDAEAHTFEPRNPLGVGFRRNRRSFEEGLSLPNLEDPRDRLGRPGQTPAPAGFGFTSPHWTPRAAFAGTYDATWEARRSPLLPEDFDPRYFNAAPDGLVANGFLRGDEPVSIEGVSAAGIVRFSLPGVPPPDCAVGLQGRRIVEPELRLDTVIVNLIDGILILLWRGQVPLRSSAEEAVFIEVGSRDRRARIAVDGWPGTEEPAEDED